MMITLLLYISIALLAGYLTVTLFNVLAGPWLAKAPAPGRAPKVSLLVPARNEEKNIEHCLQGLLGQDYPDYEIIVYDDQSGDRTAELIAALAAKDSRVKHLESKPLPRGWSGKNWACQQLSQEAQGEILIFTDADTRHAPEAVSNTVAWMEKHRLGLFTAFPQQLTGTLAEKLVIPVIDIFVYGSLPLWLTYHSRSPLIAAANGQWIAFTREAYRGIGGHGAVRDRIVEDVELSRLAKRSGVRTLVAAGTGMVYCRMYQTAGQLWEGFTKNLYGIGGYHGFAFWGVIAAFLAAFVAPYALLAVVPLNALALTAVGMNLLLRSIYAWKFRHPAAAGLLLNPLGVIYTVVIAFNSFLKARQGVVSWKGREVRVIP